MMRLKSITLRLALLFGTASTMVLIAVGVLIGALIAKHFEEMDVAELAGKVELINHTLSKVDTPNEIGHLSQHLGDTLMGHGTLSVAIVDRDGLTLLLLRVQDIPGPCSKRSLSRTAQRNCRGQ
jgi:two-component system, OmpR family, heavy metal sensor histidine kinase CusS